MIDVIIPAYNAHDTIERTLKSIAKQQNIDEIKVYIVNDKSDKDYSIEIDKFKNIMNIKELDLQVNSGPGVARQFGIDNSDSEFIVFIDSDDIFYDELSLKMLHKSIIKNNDDMVISSFYEIRYDESIKEHSKDLIWLHGKIYRREFLEKNNIRFNNTSSNEDNGFNHLCFLYGSKISCLDRFTYVWMFNENSITRRNNYEYSFGGLEGFIYNLTWALDIAIKDNCDEGKIAEVAFETLVDVYFYYLKYITYKNSFKLIKWSKRLREINLEYKYNECDIEEYINNYYIKNHSTFESISLFKDVLKFDLFLDLIDRCNCDII